MKLCSYKNDNSTENQAEREYIVLMDDETDPQGFEEPKEGVHLEGHGAHLTGVIGVEYNAILTPNTKYVKES